MIRNKLTHLLWQTAYCVLAFIGFLCSIGYFSADFNQNFHVYYTNLSNYICGVVMFVSLIRTYRQCSRGEKGACDTAPVFSFLCMLLILVTFLVYNLILADQSALEYFTSLSNVLMHCILPLGFVFHWLFCYEHGNMRWYHPLMGAIMPAIYVVYILIRAPIAKGKPGMDVYPYFFMDLDALGIGGFFGWISILLLAFLAIGYVFYGLDKLWSRRRK